MPRSKTAQQYVDLGVFNNHHQRVTLVENWLKKPGINADSVIDADADSASALVAYVIANRDFEVLGANATTATVVFSTGGGIKLTTTTSANDSVIIAPHLDTDMSAWSVIDWSTDDEVACNALLRTDSSIADTVFWYGLKLTNTSTIATDADQVFFRRDPGDSSGNWECVYSVNGTDYQVDSGVSCAVSTDYDLFISIDAQRYATFYIGVAGGAPQPVHRTAVALKTGIDLIPYTGVLTETTAAKSLTIRPGYCIGKTMNN